jgi:dolichol-phosphate mannosyltransferase
MYKNHEIKIMKYSIVVPAYKEGANLKPLTERVFAALGKKADAEMIIVDDNSNDGSVEIVKELSRKYPVSIHVRTKERGLSSAVLHGFSLAKGDILLCMDADLQHPPESVPDLLKILEDREFVIGTRYGSGKMQVDKDWPFYRILISKGARLLAYPLTPLSDPMTGFFGIQKSVLSRGKNINPVGFKIAMELFVKCGVKTFGEVPINFGNS